jgi:hypothetical protein
MKIRLVEAELFQVDRRTHMTKMTVTFRSFANAPENGILRRFVHFHNF